MSAHHTENTRAPLTSSPPAGPSTSGGRNEGSACRGGASDAGHSGGSQSATTSPPLGGLVATPGRGEGAADVAWEGIPRAPLSPHRTSTVGAGSSSVSAARAGDDAAAGSRRRSQLVLCCDSLTVQRSHSLVIDCVSSLFYGGRLTALVNCSGTNSAFYLTSALAGQEEADDGNVLLNGTPVAAAAYQNRSVFLDEDFTAFENLTVRENLEYASCMRVAVSARAYSVDDVVEQLLLASVQHMNVHTCSLYVRRRLSLGKELLRNPTVILMDQPLEGLATHEAQQFLSILRKLAAPAAADAADAAYDSHLRRLQHSLGKDRGARGEPTLDASAVAAAPRSANVLYTPRVGSSRGAATGSADAYSPPLPSASLQEASDDRGGSAPRDAPPGADVESAEDGAATTATTAAAADAAPAAEAPMERIIVFSMTQPRWALLQYVDDVVLLEESHCAYSGSLNSLLRVCFPSWALQADSATREEVSAEGVEPPVRALASLKLSPARPSNEEFVHILYRLASTGDGSLQRALGPNAAAGGRSGGVVEVGVDGTSPCSSALSRRGSGGRAAGSRNISRVRAAVDLHLQQCAQGEWALTGWQYHSPGGGVQLLYLFKYSMLQVWHKKIAYASALVAMIAITIGVTAVYYSNSGQVGIQDRVGILFFLVSTTVLQSILSVEAYRRSYFSFQRHRAHGYYTAWVYLTFTVVTSAVRRLTLTTVLALAVFAMAGSMAPSQDHSSVFNLSLVLAVTSFTSHFLVFFTCTLMLSLRVDSLALFTIYTLNTVLGGMILNLLSMPRAIQAISFASIVRLSYESAVVELFWDDDFGCSTADGDRGTPCFTGEQYARFLGFAHGRRIVNVAAMMGIAGILIASSLLVMTLYRPRHRALPSA